MPLVTMLALHPHKKGVLALKVRVRKKNTLPASKKSISRIVYACISIRGFSISRPSVLQIKRALVPVLHTLFMPPFPLEVPDRAYMHPRGEYAQSRLYFLPPRDGLR
jgi:hypothetical protein